MTLRKQILTGLKLGFSALAMLLCLQGFSQGPSFSWATGVGGTGADAGRGIGTDDAGNVYTIADFRETIDFTMKDGTTLTLNSRGTGDIFISKQDAQGAFVWVRHIGGTQLESSFGLEVDGDGNVYAIGYFQGKLYFGDMSNNISQQSSGMYDVFTCKLNTDGDFVWTQRYGGNGNDYGRDIAIDKRGNVYTIGYFVNSMDVDLVSGRQTFHSQGGDETVIMKQNQNGGIEWVKQIGGMGNDRGWSIAVDDWGNVLATGYYRGKADFDPGTAPADTFYMEAIGTDDAYVLKLNNDGDFLWARNIGGTKADIGNGITVDRLGNVYATGYFAGTCDFNPGSGQDTLASNGQTDAFIVKYDSSGNFQWVRHMGGKGEDYGRSIAVDIANNPYVLSYYNKTATYGSDTLTAAGKDDIAITKFDPQGNFLWNQSFGGALDDRAWDIKLDQASSIYVTGNFADSANFHPGMNPTDTFFLRSAGGNDIFMLKLGCADTSSANLAIETCLDSFQIGNSVYTSSGDYVLRFSNTSGCDSTVFLNLTFTKLDPVINVNGFRLGSALQYDTYQWLLNDVEIPGATDSVYDVTENGSYRLVVTSTEGCIDTSDAYVVTNYTGIKNQFAANSPILFPNPASHVIHVKMDQAVDIKILGIDGRVITTKKNAKTISVENLSSGMYYLRLFDDSGKIITTEKFVKAEK